MEMFDLPAFNIVRLAILGWKGMPLAWILDWGEHGLRNRTTAKLDASFGKGEHSTDGGLLWI